MRGSNQQVSESNAEIEDQWVRDLEQHVKHGADLPVLLMTTAHTTGNLSVLRKEWRPVDVLGVAKCDVSEQEQDRIRRECTWLLADHRRSGGARPVRPTYDFLRAVGDWFLGSGLEPYIPLLAEELVFDTDDLRRPLWSKNRIAPARSLHVAIVGAGESGIVLGVRLKQAGIPFTIYEKNADVGGTWLENSYPGCRVDINSFVYSYAFAPHLWPDYFGMRGDVLSYLQRVAKENGLYEHIKFGTEIEAASWNQETQSWDLSFRCEGEAVAISPDVVVFAVGQLNRPKLPDIPGVNTFGGASFHSAKWDYSVDMNGKSVGVIGTGASACQFIPQVAEVAQKVTVFARTAIHGCCRRRNSMNASLEARDGCSRMCRVTRNGIALDY